jgi:hypothetical protein
MYSQELFHAARLARICHLACRGADNTTLYITAQNKLYRLPLNILGIAPPSSPSAKGRNGVAP